MDKRQLLELSAATTFDLGRALTRALFFIEWLWRSAWFWAKHAFKVRKTLLKYFQQLLKLAHLRARLCFWKGWLWIVCRWHGRPFDEQASNVANNPPLDSERSAAVVRSGSLAGYADNPTLVRASFDATFGAIGPTRCHLALAPSQPFATLRHIAPDGKEL